MKRFFLKYWWLFLILPFVFTVALIHLFSNVPSVLDTIIFWLFFLSLLGLITSWILLLANEKWWQSIVVFISLIPLAFLLFILSFAAMAGPDGFGQKHPIPEGLNYNLPLQIDYYSKKSDEVVEIDSLDTSTYLQVYGELGWYNYDFYYGALPSGEIFLRCFEATENIPLSESGFIFKNPEISEDSRVQIDSVLFFSKLVDKQTFRIFEGDYEDYYAARIEVWFKDKKTRKERKLLEKIYRVEGSMR